MDTDPDKVEWLTIREAATRVDKSAKTIRRAVTAGTIVGQRSGDAKNAPWLVSSVSLADQYPGTPTLPEGTVAVLAEQLTTAMQLMNDANTRAIEATERAAVAETVADHMREVNSDQRDTIADLRDQLETAQAEPQKRRRWWRR